MTTVTKLGRWPCLRCGPKHKNERRLAQRVRSEIRSGRLSKADLALLEEMRWVHQREQEAEHLDAQQRRLISIREEKRRMAHARAARLRSLLRDLGASARRCTCHDFDCWAPLWKIDAALALDLRAEGFHFYDCALAPYDRVRGDRWDIKRPGEDPAQRCTLELANETVLANDTYDPVESMRLFDKYNDGPDDDKRASNDEVSEDGETSYSSEPPSEEPSCFDEAGGDQQILRDPVSDAMLARERRRSSVRLAALQCCVEHGGVSQPSVYADCHDDAVPLEFGAEARWSFDFFDILAICQHCGCELDLGVLHRHVQPEMQLGFSCLTIRHGGDVRSCPAYGAHSCGEARFSMRWRSAMVSVDLVPGSDKDISREDWNWLRRQCRVRSDWELGRRFSAGCMSASGDA